MERSRAASAGTVPIGRRTVLDEHPTPGAHPRLVLDRVPPEDRTFGAAVHRAAEDPRVGRDEGTQATARTEAVDAWTAVGSVAAGVAIIVITIELGRRAGAPPGVTAACSVAACSAVAMTGLAAAVRARGGDALARFGRG
ncbi:hypothetical protein [Actinomadura nitritigenes]|uniref:hypothetical protein n=1 Tax=Actinomadura nitritigenes TaxID=134602 RepID=UPI003D8A95F5